MNGRKPVDSLHEKETYIYDNKGNMTEEEVYRQDGSLNYKNIYKYDSKGNMVETDFYNSDGSLGFTNISKYDTKWNKIIESDFYASKDSLTEQVKYQLDDKGHLAKEYDNGVLKSWYIYDNKDNWIKLTTFRNNVPQAVIEREIVYY